MDITRRTLINSSLAVASGLGTAAGLAPAAAAAPAGASPRGNGATTAWRLYRHDNARTGAVVEGTLNAGNVARLQLRDVFDLDYPADSPTPPTVDGDTLTVGAGLGQVYRRRSSDLGAVWRRSVYSVGERSAPMTTIGANFIVTSGDCMATVNRSTGRLLWGRRSADYADYYAAPVLTKDAIFGVSRGGSVTSYAPASGAIRWTTSPTAWHNPTVGDTWASPAFANNRLYLAAEKVACLDASTGRVIWSKALPSGDYSLEAVVFASGRVFVAGDHGLHAFNPTTGALLWTAAIGDTNPIAVSGTRIYARSASALQCLDVATGRIMWRKTMGQSSGVAVTYANGVLYLADGSGGSDRLIAADARNGNVLWRSPTLTAMWRTPEVVVTRGSLYLSGYPRQVSRFGL